MTDHLAIMVEPYLSQIFSGEKTVETRFLKNKSAPYKKVKKNDVIYFKKSGGKIIGKAIAHEVQCFDLSNSKSNFAAYTYSDIAEKFKKEACLTDEWIKLKKDSKYVTIILLENVERFQKPITFIKNNQLPWVVNFTLKAEVN